MEFMPGLLSREHSDDFAQRIREHFEESGYGQWAAETRGAPFMGFIGLHWARFEAPFSPALEVSFRLAYPYWGNGYATEGARAAIQWAFENTGVKEIVSFTSVLNVRSQSVMWKAGLKRDSAGDFDHPRLPEDHPLRPHALFRISREDWPGDNVTQGGA